MFMSLARHGFGYFGGGAGSGRMGLGAGTIGTGWFLAIAGIKLLIFIVLVIVAIRMFKKHNAHINSISKADDNDPLRILDEKFAKGEYTEEEYLKRKEILSKKD
ncbi:MAG: SHOCT domain-containing protein [Clostridiaceae bacterium]